MLLKSLVKLYILLLLYTTCIFSTVVEVEREEDKERHEMKRGLNPEQLPLSQLFTKNKEITSPSEQNLHRDRRGFRSYFYNYLDEIAMSICASIPSEGPGLIYAVRRTCGEKQTCKDICNDHKLRQQGPKEVQSLQWTCSESLHVYKRQPSLADNYEDYTDSHKLGLAIYRHYSCTIGGCGPNYCCCRAA